MINAWERIQIILEKSLKPGIFKLWIKPLQGEYDSEVNLLKLTAPNEFIASWVREKLKKIIIESSLEVLGREPELSVACSGNNSGSGPLKPVTRITEQKQVIPAQECLKVQTSFRFRFDDFVVGPCNELAYAASRSFCRENITSDQLFLCSSTGLGKTHLAQAMGHYLGAICNKSSLRLAYLTAEEFAGQLVMAIRAKQMDAFKSRFRESIDVLLLEDIHFFQGKENIQNEFLSTINSLQCQGKKVVLTSTFLPKELNGLDSNLVSRLCRGFLAVIDRPDMKTRQEILKNKARALKVSIPDEVADFLAGRIQKDIRQLESCLHNLIFKARMLKEQITLELAGEVIKNFDFQKDSLDLDQIVNQVCRVYDVSLDNICSKSRKKQYVLARNVAFYLARKHTDHSLKEIGQRFNRRHSTVIKGVTCIEKEISRRSPAGRQLEKVMNQILY